jgi:hypothetical protein
MWLRIQETVQALTSKIGSFEGSLEKEELIK